ncbi:permease [Paenibacillus sp. MBLB4367]|uniref:permease n=1 Tax=Paenibacillus sp. MBLB4367 TaxID=3384767 RepID=UPI00390812CF
MFAGHFGLAAAVKAKSPETPLWALMLGTQLLDVIFVPLFLSGIETMEPVADGGFGEHIIHADYTHSLLGALLIALAAGLMAGKRWGKRGGAAIGSVVFSHWLLDLLVHRADMPLLPGNWGDLPTFGFGLWQYPYAEIAVEAALIAAGAILYYRSAASLRGHDAKTNRLRVAATAALSVLLVAALASDVIGIG